MKRKLILIGLALTVAVSGCIGQDTGVENWSCVVTEDYNATAGGGAVYEGGNCAVLQAGCRRQAECEIHTKPDVEDTWYIENINIEDPEIQKRLR